MRKQTGLTVLVALSIVLTACRPVLTSDGRCMHDFDTFAYRDFWRLSSESVSPLEPWQSVIPARGNGPLFSRVVDGQQEIWMDNGSVYRVEADTWQQTRLSDALGGTFDLMMTYAVDNNGQVWGLASQAVSNRDAQAVLTRYRETENDFIAVVGAVTESARKDNIQQVALLIDSLNRAWMVLSVESDRDTFYLYDTSSETFSRIPDRWTAFYRQTILSPDGQLYHSSLSADGYFPMYEIPMRASFARYDAENEQWVDLDLPNGFQPGEGNLGFDPQGRLYIGTSGWRDTDCTWHITYPYDTQREDVFPRLELKLISSDGRFWFTRAGPYLPGTAWYDPPTGEGCVFTNLMPHTII